MTDSEIPIPYRGLSFHEMIAEAIRQDWAEQQTAYEAIARHLAQFPPPAHIPDDEKGEQPDG